MKPQTQLIGLVAINVFVIIAVLTVGAMMRHTASITGNVASTGTTQITLLTTSSLIFVVNAVDFGTGGVNRTVSDRCILEVNETGHINKTGCTQFNNQSVNGTFTIENDGTQNLTLSISSTLDPKTVIGGTSTIANLEYKITEAETGSCVGLASQWNNLTTSQTNECLLLYDDSKDRIKVLVRLTIPSNAPRGARDLTIIAEGTS